MALPNSYSMKAGSMAAYFTAILKAEAPERFTHKFLENLGFSSTNDRTLIGILKELGFLDSDGVPLDRYHAFLDRTQSKRVLAEGIREAYSDLFNVNKESHKLSVDDVKNKLRTLYKGSKKDNLIARIASTFTALCAEAEFDKLGAPPKPKDGKQPEKIQPKKDTGIEHPAETRIAMESLQYHINIILPESRDQAVYDAIFKSLREHLG